MNLHIPAGMALLDLVTKNPNIRRLGTTRTRISEALRKKISLVVTENHRKRGAPHVRHYNLIPRSEFFEAKGAFDKLDKNKDGRINAEEFTIGFSAKTATVRKQARAIYTHVDKDFSGTVDFLEFLQASFPNISKEDIIYAVEVYSKFEVLPTQKDVCLTSLTDAEKEEITAIFRRFDVNGDGHVSYQELKEKMIECWDDADMDEVFKTCDEDSNQELNLEEFMFLMADYYSK
jgi:Ca2+-binding EF-hand superfamily protein